MEKPADLLQEFGEAPGPPQEANLVEVIRTKGIRIKVTEWKIEEETNGKYATYRVETDPSSFSYYGSHLYFKPQYHRYSEFLELHETLNGMGLVPSSVVFPPKRYFFGNLNPSF